MCAYSRLQPANRLSRSAWLARAEREARVRAGKKPIYMEKARELGEEMARRGIGLVFGGGNVGLMGWRGARRRDRVARCC
jgi:predicted Rossmann-fold nucleotide-binding protein